jgi:hypothetical protein
MLLRSGLWAGPEDGLDISVEPPVPWG